MNIVRCWIGLHDWITAQENIDVRGRFVHLQSCSRCGLVRNHDSSLEHDLNRLEQYEENWGGYGEEPPTLRVIKMTRNLTRWLFTEHAYPSHIGPNGRKGAMIYFGGSEALIEIHDGGFDNTVVCVDGKCRRLTTNLDTISEVMRGLFNYLREREWE